MRFAKTLAVLPLAAVVFLTASGAGAHHAPSMFEQRQVTVSGTVRQFQWTNPHCYIQMSVENAAGQEEEWSLEMGAPMYLYNRGWRPSSLRPGDRISVTLAPLRSGRTGGLVISVNRLDGKPLGRVE